MGRQNLYVYKQILPLEVLHCIIVVFFHICHPHQNGWLAGGIKKTHKAIYKYFMSVTWNVQRGEIGAVLRDAYSTDKTRELGHISGRKQAESNTYLSLLYARKSH